VRLLATALLVVLYLPIHRGLAAEPTATPPTAAGRHALTADDGHTLTLWSKLPPAPKGAILLLHGRTWSALPNFDLQVAGTPRSVMDALVYRGYAAYALDQRGYGASPRDASGWLTPNRAAADALAAAALIRQRHPQLAAPAVVGYSMGAMTAMLAAQQQPAAFSALVLYGFPADPDQPPAQDPGADEPLREATTLQAAGEDFVVAGAAPPEVAAAYARQAVAADPVRVDWKHHHEFRFQPDQLTTPTLLLQGVADGYVKPDAVARLFTRLATPDRSWVVLPDSDHAAHVENAMPAWVAAVVDFLERPRPGRQPVH
jgi:alpha-beta hydrolase superfamily lysophospholipase